MPRLIIFILLMLFNASAWAQTDVTIQVNKTDTGHRVVFLGMTDDFALFTNEVGEIKIRFNPKYKIVASDELNSRLNDVISNLIVVDNEINFRLKNRAFNVRKYSSMEVFAIDITAPENAQLLADDEDNIDAPIELQSGAFAISGESLSTNLTYTTDKIIAAAAFVINDRIIMFFQGNPINFQELANLQNDFVRGFKILAASNANGLVVEVRLSEAALKYHPVLKRNQNVWYLDFSETLPKTSEIKVTSMPIAAPKPRVEVTLTHAAMKPISFFDPETGISYKAILSRDDMFANSINYNFVDFRILQSIQGTIVQEISDSLEYKPRNEKLIIQTKNRMNLSNKHIEKEQRYEDAKDSFKLEEFVPDYKSILSLRFYKISEGKYVDNLRMLRRAINRAKTPDDRVKLMANLAMFYTANSLYYESLGTISAIKRASPSFYNTYNIRAIEGANYFFIRDYKSSFDSFSSIKVSDVPNSLRREIRFWQIVSAYIAGQADPEIKTENFTKLFFEDNNFLREYTVDARQSIALAIIDKKINDGDFEASLRLLKYISKFTTTSQKVTNLYHYYTGLYYLKREEYENADKYFKLCLEADKYLYTKARCSYYKAVGDYNNLQITKSEYTKKLNFLTYLWHGDELELAMLFELSDLYESQGDFFNSLRVMDKAISYFPQNVRILSLKERATKLFSEYFLEGIDKKQASLDSLLIFYDYQKYIPIGEKGDDVVLRFTEHLISLDLLDRAAAILYHQVNHRLRGFKREEAINRLAFVHNSNLQPFYAIEVLKMGESWQKLPDYIGLPRKYLFAQSYYLNSQDDEALNLLQGDYSLRADEIKSDIFWRQQNWREFLNYAEPRIYDLRKTTGPISADDAMKVLKVAIAYLKNNDNQLLVFLSKDFLGRMDENSEAYTSFKTIYDSWQSAFQNDVAPQELIDRINKITKELAAEQPTK